MVPGRRREKRKKIQITSYTGYISPKCVSCKLVSLLHPHTSVLRDLYQSLSVINLSSLIGITISGLAGPEDDVG